MTASPSPGAGIRDAIPLLAAGFVISFVVVGGGIDTAGVFMNAIARATDWSRSSLSLGVSVGAMMAALCIPLVGVWIDRFGVRVPMTIGVGLLFAGFVILAVMNQPWHFVAANVFLGPGFAAGALLPITVAVTVRVPGRTALALGIVGAGSSAGTLVLAPAVQAAIDTLGWRNAYIAMGSAVIFTPVPFLLFALPRGRLRGEAAAYSALPARNNVVTDLRKPGIVPLAGMMLLPGLTAFSIAVHLVPYLTGIGHTATRAAAALGTTIGVSALGKVAGGFVADRVGVLRTARFALVLWVVAMAILHHAATLPALGAFVLTYGLALGTQIAVIPAIAVAVLGTERFGTLFGLMQLGALLASAVGPVLSGLIFDKTGTYGGAILLWAIAMISAAAMAFWMPTAHAEAVTAAKSRAVT